MKGSQVTIGQKKGGGDVLVSGSGLVLASLALEQDAAYWEILVEKADTPFSIGVSRAVHGEAAELLENGPLSWCLNLEPAKSSSGSPSIEEGKQEEITCKVKHGDVIGCIFSQSTFPMMSFTKNGEPLLGLAIERVRGLVYPAVHLKGGDTVLNFRFHENDWYHAPPSSRFLMVMESRDMF